MALRIIQLIAPNNQAMKIDLNGEENELIDLISMISGIPNKSIKGIKDCYGNYYTMSSAICSPQINSENSDVYFLICAPSSEYCSYNPTKPSNFNSTPRASKLTSNKGIFGSFSYDPKKFFKKEDNLDIYTSNHGKINSAKKYQDRAVRYNPFGEERISENICGNNELKNDHETEYFKINKINKCVNNEYYENTNNITKQIINPPIAINMRQEASNILKDLQKNKVLREYQISYLTHLIDEGNQEIIDLIRLYSQEIIDENSFKAAVDKILSKLINSKYFIESNSKRKEKLFQIIEYFSSSGLLENLEELNLLKNLVEYENIYVIKAYELYEANGDYESFKDSMLEIMQSRKHLYHSIYDINKFKQENSEINKSNNYNNNSPLLDKKVEEKILSNLHTEEKIIFKYAIRNNFKELQILSELYGTFQKEEILIKPIKLLCQNFIKDNVTHKMSESKKSLFYELLTARNQYLIEIFKEFREHYRIKKLERDINAFISKQGSPVSISTIKASYHKTNKKRKISSSENSDDEDTFSENKSKNENNNKSYSEFINLVNVMNFLNPDEKKEFEISIKKNTPSAIQLVNDYYKNKNILSIKSSLLSLIRKNKNGLNNSANSGLEKTVKDRDLFRNTAIHSKNNSKTSELNQKFNSYENIVSNLMKTEKISSEQQKYLMKKFEHNDEKIHSVWEVYKHNNNLNDLIESLIILSKDFKKNKINHIKPNKNRELFSKSRKEIEYYKNKKITDEKDETKMKQLNVIKVLEKENVIEKEKIKIINQLIEDENNLLISAFEVLSVTKDPKEFVETLNLICENFKNKNKKEKEDNILKSNNHLGDNKDSRVNLLFNQFINYTKYFDHNEKNILTKLFSNKNEFILSALELYEKTNDEVDFVDSLQIVLKNFKN